MRGAGRRLRRLVARHEPDDGLPAHHRLPGGIVRIEHLHRVRLQPIHPRLRPGLAPGLVERGEMGQRGAAGGRREGDLALEPWLRQDRIAGGDGMLPEQIRGDEQHHRAPAHCRPGAARVAPQGGDVVGGDGHRQELASLSRRDGAIGFRVPAKFGPFVRRAGLPQDLGAGGGRRDALGARAARLRDEPQHGVDHRRGKVGRQPDLVRRWWGRLLAAGSREEQQAADAQAHPRQLAPRRKPVNSVRLTAAGGAC